MKDIKELYPGQVAKFVSERELMEGSTFAWWAIQTLKEQTQILSKVKSRMAKKMQKFDLEVPYDVKESYTIDVKNGNTFGHNVITKEVRNVMALFNILDDDRKITKGHQHLDVHLIFGIKMDLTRKAELWLDTRHLTQLTQYMPM